MSASKYAKVDFDQYEKALNLAIKSLPQSANITKFTSPQRKALKSIFLDKKHTFLAIPTGSGKTLVSFLSPRIAKNLDNFPTINPKIIFVCPLLALMETLFMETQRLGLHAFKIEDGTKEIDPNCEIYFISPERIKCQSSKNFLDSIEEDIILKVIDEAHFNFKLGIS